MCNLAAITASNTWPMGEQQSVAMKPVLIHLGITMQKKIRHFASALGSQTHQRVALYIIILSNVARGISERNSACFLRERI